MSRGNTTLLTYLFDKLPSSLQWARSHWLSRIGLSVLIVSLAGVTNLWSANLFFGLSFVFGIIWAYLAVAYLGLWTGLFAGLAAVIVAFLKIHNPLFVCISLPEVIFVCLLYRIYQKDLIHGAVLYWLTLGPLLYYGFYCINFSPDFDNFDYLVVFLKLAVNGMLNALFASLLSLFLRLGWPYTSHMRMQVPIHQAIFCVLVTLILVPSLWMTSIHSQARYERMEDFLLREVKGKAELMSQFLEEWYGRSSQTLTPVRLKELLSRLVVRDGWEASIFDSKGQIIVSTSPNAPQNLPRAQGSKMRMLSPSSYAHEHSGPKDSPFIRWQKIRIGALVPVPTVNWTIVAEGPTSNYAKPLKQGLIENLVLMLVLCFLGFFVSRFLARIIGRPIQVLAGLTSHLHKDAAYPPQNAWPQSRIREIAWLISNYQAMQQELNRRFQELKTADQAKSAFLATMSHEIRTPLGAILGFSDLLLKNPAYQGTDAEHLRAIKRNGEQLLAVIGDVLDLSKIEAGKLCLEKLAVSVPSLLDDVLRSLRLQAEAKGLCFDLSLSPDLPDTIVTDPTRFRQVLWNLTSNAIKFTTVGRISVVVKADWLEAAGEYQLSFAIEDSGIGISQEQQERIFMPFVQADSSMNRKFGGSGLGLVLSRRLAEAMKGSLTLAWSHMGVGSCFCFQLSFPREHWNVEPAPQLEESSRPLTPVSADYSPRVLLVDDAPDNLLLVKFLLESQGADVMCAKDALEGLDHFRSHRPNLVVTDIQMPIMDGYEFVKCLRDIDQTVPIVAMTAHALSEEQDRCLAAGCNAYLSKPLNSEKLFDVFYSLAFSSSPSSSQG